MRLQYGMASLRTALLALQADPHLSLPRWPSLHKEAKGSGERRETMHSKSRFATLRVVVQHRLLLRHCEEHVARAIAIISMTYNR